VIFIKKIKKTDFLNLNLIFLFTDIGLVYFRLLLQLLCVSSTLNNYVAGNEKLTLDIITVFISQNFKISTGTYKISLSKIPEIKM